MKVKTWFKRLEELSKNVSLLTDLGKYSAQQKAEIIALTADIDNNLGEFKRIKKSEDKTA